MFMGLCSMDRIWSQASLSMSPLHWVHVWLHKLVKPGLILLWFVSLYLGWHHFIFPSGEPSACHLSSLIFLHYDLDAPPPVPHSHSHILTRAASTLAHPNPWRTTAVGLSLLSHPLLQICVLAAQFSLSLSWEDDTQVGEVFWVFHHSRSQCHDIPRGGLGIHLYKGLQGSQARC